MKAHLESNLPISDISPAYQWAQSPDEIFLSIKFAHKLDTPGALNVEAKNVTLLPHLLELHAADGRKSFRLSVPFLKEIIPDESTWSMASVGRMSFTLKKREGASAWGRLLASRQRVPNQHFWLAMHEKYATLLDKITNKDEDDEEETLRKSKMAKPKVTSPQTAEPNLKIVPSETATAVPNDNPELAAMLDKLTADHAAEVARLESEAKSKRKEVDLESKRRKLAIKKELEEAKVALDEKLKAEKAKTELDYVDIADASVSGDSVEVK